MLLVTGFYTFVKDFSTFVKKVLTFAFLYTIFDIDLLTLILINMDATIDYLKKSCEYVHYACGSYAYFDGLNYYNDSGQLLRDPIEYDEYSEGYTPFGDE